MVTCLAPLAHFSLVVPLIPPSKNSPRMCSSERRNAFNINGRKPESPPASALKFEVLAQGPLRKYDVEERPGIVQREHSQFDKIIEAFSGKLLNGGLVFQENSLIRSYELDPDGRVSIAALVNRFQESSLNHYKRVGLIAEGFGSTPEMSRRNLIWVMCRLQVVVEHLPSWADIVQVETWGSASGKYCQNRNWLVRDYKTGETLVRGTSLFLMMNKKTRKPSFVKEAWAEQEPHILNCDPIINEDKRKLPQLDVDTADYVRTCSAQPSWHDLDLNQHVKHVKYIRWILESAPRSVLETHKLSSMKLEYRKECGSDSMLQSLCAVSRNGTNHSADDEWVELNHLLRLEDGSEILRGRSMWMPK